MWSFIFVVLFNTWACDFDMAVGCPICDNKICKLHACDVRSINFDQLDPTLTELITRYNGLENIDYFPYFPSLEIIDIKGEMGITVFPNLENVSHSLIELKITDGRLHTISQRHMAVLSQLTLLDLGGNFIRSPFPDMDPGTQLTRLRLRANLLDEIPVLPTIAERLVRLVLTRNIHFTTPSPQTLAMYKHVTAIFLEHSLLGYIPDFCPLRDTHVAPSLELKLENNSITYLDAASVRCINNPTWILRLEHNQIIQISNMLHLDVQISISPQSENLQCDCGLLWLKAMGNSASLDMSSAKCGTPERLGGRSFSALTMDDLTCEGLY